MTVRGNGGNAGFKIASLSRQTTSGTDVNGNGAVNSTDTSIVQSKSGTGL